MDEILKKSKKSYHFFMFNDFMLKTRPSKSDRNEPRYQFISKIEWSKTTLTDMKNEIRLIEVGGHSGIPFHHHHHHHG